MISHQRLLVRRSPRLRKRQAERRRSAGLADSCAEPDSRTLTASLEVQANNKRPKRKPGDPMPMGRRATEEAELKREFLREYEAEGPPQDQVDRVSWDD